VRAAFNLFIGGYVPLRQVAQKKPIELLSALVMIFAGVYLSGTGATGSFALIVGNMLSAFGGALLSWSTVSLTSKEAAAEILSPQLSAIARQLVTVSGQISKAVQDSRNGILDESVALEMISQAARIMYASVNEIHVVLDQRVDAQALLDTAQRVEELATKLAGSPAASQDEVESELISSVAELRTQIQVIAQGSTKMPSSSKKQIPKAAPHELETAATECPSCKAQTMVEIGTAFGSSAMPICTICKTSFHAHRAQDGTVISKLPGKKGSAVANISTAPAQ
jgi:transposase-like protein